MKYSCLLIKRITPDCEDVTPIILTPETTVQEINEIIEWFGKNTQVISVELSYTYTAANALEFAINQTK